MARWSLCCAILPIVLSGCGPECQDAGDIPIMGSEAEEAAVRETLDQFQRWTGTSVCARKVRVRRDDAAQTATAKRVGAYSESTGTVHIWRNDAEWSDLNLVHELCHAHNDARGVTVGQEDVFRYVQRDFEVGLREEHGDEGFAIICEVGPAFLEQNLQLISLCGIDVDTEPLERVLSEVYRGSWTEDEVPGGLQLGAWVTARNEVVRCN